MAKYNPEKISECAAWVEEHGLHPQACGATIGDFCAAMGIDPTTWRDWDKRPEFHEAIERAREAFKARTVNSVENALIRAALGVEFDSTKEKGKAVDEIVREYDPATGALIRETKTKKLVTVEAVRERRFYPPDVKAATFILTNLENGTWRNKQDVNVGATGPAKIEISVGDQKTADNLQKVLANGAKPAEK